MGSARRILLVDEDPAVRKIFEQVFSARAIAVIAVASGEEALWQLGNGAYDAVFGDLVLRGMSGLEMAEEIRASRPGLPVVIIAGRGAESAQDRAAAGVSEFLRMPLSAEELAKAADRVLQAAESLAASQPRAQQPAAAQATTGSESRLKDVVLFLSAPLIALAYVLAFPVIGLGMLVFSAFEKKPQAPEDAEPLPLAAPAKPSLLKAVGMMLAMAVVGVFYGLLAPIMGIVLVLWFGLEAWGKLGARAVGPGQT